jgi:hydrogenase-4 component B
MSERLLIVGVVIAAVSGVPGLFISRHSMRGQLLSAVLAVLASGFGLVGIGVFWFGGDSQPIKQPWALFGSAPFSVGVDGLSAFFLLPIFLVSLLGNVYGLGYWRQSEHPENGRRLRLFYGTLIAGMALLVIARNSIVFLFGWEAMALSAFFLVTTEDHDPEVRETGLLYFAATHVATLSLFGLFALLNAASGSFTLSPLGPSRLTAGTATAMFVLALVGFGLKAGIMPLHIWLPSAHAAAPSHISALMSGVLIKTGIYGLVRVTSFFPDPPLEWGGIVLSLGVISGILGVAFAIGQHDIKRLLAYHSVENIGIIVMGLGLALIGRSLGRADLVVLGLAGCLLHVWNHAFFKSLLFLSAGSVIHAAHTRDIDRLGGLAKAMPWTALSFLVGAVAICGLPPLNGFVSEFLIYLGLFGTLENEGGPSIAAAAFAAPALALVGALAVACFVKAYGAIFLGTARSDHCQGVHESRLTILGPMGVLAVCCFLIGLAPVLVTPILAKAITAWDPGLTDAGVRLKALAPLGWVSVMGLFLSAALLVACAGLWFRLWTSVVERRSTWGCAYSDSTPRMQYTSSSFAQMLVGVFAWVLRPRTRWPGKLSLFPQASSFSSHVEDFVLDQAVLPSFQIGARLFSWFRVLQQGNVQAYLLYIFIALIILLLWR